MYRALVIILFLLAGLTSCKKDLLGSRAAYEAQAGKDDELVQSYLKANSLQATKADTSGVYYIIEQPGTGTDLFTASTQVSVGYVGKVINKDLSEQVFARSDDPSKGQDFHPTFVLSQVILGWQLGIPYGQKGGKIRLFIPSRYAYGPNAQPLVGTQYGLKGGLPANAVLDFEITLYDIIN
ncbi:FKBP-type peptidyl-prolyl cis-trans isomerase [Mucilaginibacter ximonensis]|uniref:Peptidyl-prolyl cis-trans isomerase n=1 Tax=Mucilaginibacter ximonensis TaxID=538021 RepID=A0ABW5YGI3_9SPHI